MPKLLKACPSAKEQWEEHLEDWGDEKSGYYNDISIIAHHIVESFTSGNTEEFCNIFNAMEELLKDGDSEVMELASIGLIEDIQNIASHQDHGYTVFEKWLGPLSTQAWREIEGIWVGKSSLMDVIRSEKGN